jgi:hypothetical protein
VMPHEVRRPTASFPGIHRADWKSNAIFCQTRSP